MILIFFIGRLSLFILYFDQFKDLGNSMYLTFIYGLRMDTIVAFMFLLIPLILTTFSPYSFKLFVSKILRYYFLIVISFIIYIENATFPFFAQYDVRPNYLFVEYLVYPKEVFSMIFAQYKLELSVAILFISLFVYFYLKNSKYIFIDIFKLSYLKRVLLFIPLLIVLFMGIRSSLGHRGANVSDAMYSSNRIINEISKNSIHSILYAVYVNTKHGSKNIMKIYGQIPLNEAIQRVQKRLNITSIDDKLPFTRIEQSHFQTKNPKNLVIFLQESLGYQFTQEKGITPNINLLKQQGINFSNLYSNGTRSVRGIAGSVAGNLSVPGKGVIKRNKSQKDFFTIAQLLKPYGYHTSFIYGGESRFDNMKSWFLGNGFDQIIDEPKFDNPSYVGTWGVSDEDMVVKANDTFKKLYSKQQKFASVMFSTSNHSPFDFPENKITLIDGVPQKSVQNAIKYADFAIGQFFELAKKEEYYKDTIFVVLADHNIRVYGKDMVPVNMFHIPGFILGVDVEILDYTKLTSQGDVLATAIDLIGIDDPKYPILGHSIFSSKKQNLNLLQFNTTYALRVDNKVAILRANKKPITFKYENKHLIQIKDDKELNKDVLAFIIVLNDLYENKKYSNVLPTISTQ
jgi:phosphoglycerol transferase MdoB-like AlkP superfamily enzyme